MTADVLAFRDQRAALREAIERYARRNAPAALSGAHLERYVKEFTATTLHGLGNLRGSARDHRRLIRSFEEALR